MAQGKRDGNIMTATEVAEYLGCGVETARRHAAQWGGFRLPGSRRWLFRRDILEAITLGETTTVDRLLAEAERYDIARQKRGLG